MKLPKTKIIPTEKLSYGSIPIYKSMIVPGWGQYHKGQPKKGLLFLIGEGLAVSSVFISDYLYKDYNQKAWEAKRNEDLRDDYNTLSGQWKTVRTFSFIGAAAIYLFNVADVISSKGAKLYANNDNHRNLYINLIANSKTINVVFSMNL